MKVGLSASSSLETDPPQLGARWIAERAAAAHDAGLDLFSVGDNHVVAKRYYQNTPTLGWAANHFTNAPIGCLFLLPLWNPVLVAEQVGTLASLNDHPFVLQTGLGRTMQAVTMGSPQRHRGNTLEAMLPLLRKLFAGETASDDFLGVANASVDLLPANGVEFWVGGSVPAAIDRAARLGDVWYASSHLTPELAGTLMGIYLESCERAGTTPRAAIRQDVIVLRDEAKATRLGDDLLAAGYRGFANEAVSVGSPAKVAEELAVFRDLGFTDATCRCMTIDQPEALETIELLAEVRELLG